MFFGLFALGLSLLDELLLQIRDFLFEGFGLFFVVFVLGLDFLGEVLQVFDFFVCVVELLFHGLVDDVALGVHYVVGVVFEKLDELVVEGLVYVDCFSDLFGLDFELGVVE